MGKTNDWPKIITQTTMYTKMRKNAENHHGHIQWDVMYKLRNTVGCTQYAIYMISRWHTLQESQLEHTMYGECTEK